MAQTVKNLPSMQEIWVQSLGQEDPLEKRLIELEREDMTTEQMLK